jgi:O-antigen/teichoic acid export membrane protein
VRVTAVVSIGSGLVAASAGQWIVTRIFGKTFNGSGAAFELLVWTGVVIAIGHNWGELCIASKRNRLLMQSTFLGAFVNLAVCAATVSRMGIRGAALSNMLAEIAVHAVLIASFGWHMGLSVLREAWKPIVAGGGAYGVSMATRWCWPPLCALLAGIVYTVLLLVIGGVTRSDICRLRSFVPGRGRAASESLA